MTARARCHRRPAAERWPRAWPGAASPTSTPRRSAGRCTPPTPRSTGCRRWSWPGPGTSTRSTPSCAVARQTGVPVTMRGAGTSIAGNAVGPGMVVDTSRHLRRVLSLDPEARTAVVQPGTVHATLQRRGGAARAALRPRPLDPHPLHRRRHDRQQRLRLPGPGLRPHRRQRGRARRRDRRRTAGRRDGPQQLAESGRRAAWRRSAPSRAASRARSRATRWSTCSPRTVGRSTASWSAREGTLAVVRRATVRLVQDAPARVLVVLGYPSMADAADAVPCVLRARSRSPARAWTSASPRWSPTRRSCRAGGGWLFVELTGETPAEVAARAEGLAGEARSAGAWTPAWSPTCSSSSRCGGSGRTAPGWPPGPPDPPGQAGWEDAAVPPERLGAYLRDFDALLEQHGLHGAPYGHFGDGCVHVRLDFDLVTAAGRAGYRAFVEDAARLAASYGGSLSGEHGDGRARSELLGTMYSTRDAGALRRGSSGSSTRRTCSTPGCSSRRPRSTPTSGWPGCRWPGPRPTLRLHRDARRPGRPPSTGAPASASVWPTTPATPG